MKKEKLNFGIIFRIGISLLPILFGMGIPAMVWCSFNIAMSYIVFGPLTSFVSSLSAICISMVLYGFAGGDGAKIEGLFLALQAIFSAFACVYAIAKKKDFFTGVWLSSIGFLIPFFLSLKNVATQAGLSITQFFAEKPLEALKAEYATIGKEAGIHLSAKQIDALFNMLREIMTKLMPSIIIIISIVIGYLIMWCINARLRNVPGIGFEHSFSKIRIPYTMLAAAVLSLATALIGFNEDITFVALNAFSILFTICFFAGVSFIEFYLRQAVQSKVLRVILHVCIVMFSSNVVLFNGYVNIATIYAILAAVDTFFDFRKIKKRRELRETEE